MQFLRFAEERLLTDDRSSQTTQVAFLIVCQPHVKLVRDHRVKNGVSEKFETLVIFIITQFMFIAVGAVRQSVAQQPFITKRITQNAA